MDLDNDNNITSNNGWKGEQSMTCLQLFDVALTETQVRRARDLCKTGGELDCVSAFSDFFKFGRATLPSKNQL